METKETEHKIEIKKTKNGVTIWVNGRWVLDASLFNKNMSLTLDTDRMKEIETSFDSQKVFKYDRRFK